jgi:hypothetical protein
LLLVCDARISLSPRGRGVGERGLSVDRARLICIINATESRIMLRLSGMTAVVSVTHSKYRVVENIDA